MRGAIASLRGSLAAVRGAIASHERHDLRGGTNVARVGPCEPYATAPEREPVFQHLTARRLGTELAPG